MRSRAVAGRGSARSCRGGVGEVRGRAVAESVQCGVGVLRSRRAEIRRVDSR